jgi:hypothetical protein
VLKYEMISRGLLGIASIYLTYLLFFPPKNLIDAPITSEVDLFEDLKYIYAGFFLSIVISLAVYYLFASIVYYVQLFTS